MHKPLAQTLSDQGYQVITVDLLGHGQSERPRNMWRYSMPFFAEQVVALMDHLSIEESVVGGTSLGANVTLEIASKAPSRLRGMILEMPVLDNALLGCALTFTPLVVGLTFGNPLAKLVQRAAKSLPVNILPYWADVALDFIRQDPGPSAAVVQGITFGRVAPDRGERRGFNQPALVIGHRRDPVHPFSDSDMIADELPNARLVEASSILELRLFPSRLTDEIQEFITECWLPRAAEKPSRIKQRQG